MIDPDIQQELKDLQDQIDYLEQRRITQADVLPGSIKQRAISEGVRYINSGLAAQKPTTGSTPSLGTDIYFATDTHTLYVWDPVAKQWRYTVMT